MAGDLNSKHTNLGCHVNNPNSIKLQTFISNTPYTVSAPGDPTNFPMDCNRHADILDILLIKSIPYICVQEPLAMLESDHILVKILINSSSHVKEFIINVKPN